MLRIKKVWCEGMCIVHVEDDDAVATIQTFTDEVNAKNAIKLFRDVLTDLGVKVEVEKDDRRR